MKRVVVLGGGTGGTLSANRLRRDHSLGEVAVTVVDEDDEHVYQPGLLFVPFGLETPESITRSRSDQLRPGIEFRRDCVDHVDLSARRVSLTSGQEIEYDVLVIATGATLDPEETEGLTGPGWGERVFTFYTRDGARDLARALSSWRGGRLVVDVVDTPIKCPVAPLEFCFLADWFLTTRGVRESTDITFVTPLDGPFTKPVAARHLGALLGERHVNVVSEFATASVDGEARVISAYDGREVPFDLAVVIPAHTGAPYVGRSPGLGDALDFIPTDPHTLQSRAAPEVFVLGDAAALATSKAGSVAHFEGEVLVENVRHFLAGEPLRSQYDGHANCFIETGFHKALLIDFNYELEPVSGHYPSVVGLPLLKESRLNHWGKLMFQQVYWHSLLPGRDVPGVSSAMPRGGKHVAEVTERTVT